MTKNDKIVILDFENNISKLGCFCFGLVLLLVFFFFACLFVWLGFFGFYLSFFKIFCVCVCVLSSEMLRQAFIPAYDTLLITSTKI